MAPAAPQPAQLQVLLQVRALACSRGGRRLFAGLDLDLRAGELVWLRGANGCGKTTLLRTLAGLASPDEGHVRRPAAAAPLYLAHASGLKADLTVAESLQFADWSSGRPTDGLAIRRALSRLDIAALAARRCGALSQGQRRRVALARLALALDEPPGQPGVPAPSAALQSLWLLDEPFDALDADALRALGKLLADHTARGGAVLFTSHAAEEAALGLPIGVKVRPMALPARPQQKPWASAALAWTHDQTAVSVLAEVADTDGDANAGGSGSTSPLPTAPGAAQA